MPSTASHSPSTDADGGPSRKRQRTDNAVATIPVESAFKKDLLGPATSTTLAEQFAESKPYLHCVIDGLIDDGLLRKVRDEIKDALHFTVKETDIYKVFQTGDLANLDGLPPHELSKLTSLFTLRNALYSSEFRSFLARVTGCGSLSGTKTDMSINTYMEGCHLLNHDDVIGSRRVSYILYLTDPEEEWKEEYGGALELYPVVKKGTPGVAPTKSIPPKWNQFVMFTVQPGHSFHSVEEVVVDGKPRLSISGWFHVPQAGEIGYDEEREKAEAKSSLEQLQEEDEDEGGFVEYESSGEQVGDGTEEEDVMLGEEDIKYLAEWINPQYLKPTTVDQVSERFLEDSSIQLVDFLKKDVAAQIEAATREQDERDGLHLPQMPKHGTGEDDDWKAQGPPHKWRYLSLQPSAKPSTQSPNKTTPLFAGLRTLFSSPSFRTYLTLLTHLHPTSNRGLARRFRPGLDYTLATSSRASQILDATLCLAPSAASPTSLWSTDEVGGYDCYMSPHTDTESDPAVYKMVEDEGALLTVSCGWNVLNLVVRDEGLMKFIKYVSARSEGSRWDVAFEYGVRQDEEDGEEEEGEGKDGDGDE
ncbi:hypothetical protein HK104_003651 [Borealophlyctis nickersoniae]|nr:hypothetical protein HK104_003651 [Borealophlyctis nickersoniae]